MFLRGLLKLNTETNISLYSMKLYKTPLTFKNYYTGNISHRFPNPNNYLGQLKLWVSIIGHELCSMTPLEIYHRKRVCSIHFTDDSLSPGTSKLKRNALPTLHMPPGTYLLFILLFRIFVRYL